MRRIIKVLIALALAVLCATPAFALRTKLTGFYNARGIADNFVANNNYVGTLADNVNNQAVVDQRLRLKLDTEVNEFLSFTYYAEIDMQWGDSQYNDSGRNDGGGIGADTTNVETKNAYIDVKVPDSNSKFRIGLQGIDDQWDYSFFTADMAGVKYTTKVGLADITAGWFRLGTGIEDPTPTNKDNDLWVLQSSFNVSPTFKWGADYYYYQNGGNHNYATSFGTTDIQAVLDFRPETGTWTANRGAMNLHYLGGRAEYRLANVMLNGWIYGNFGTVDNINNNTATPDATQDIDVRGLAARLNATTNIRDVKLKLSGTYFSGDDDLTDGNADFIVNPLATESFAFATDGFMIFTPDIAWNSVGQYGFAMLDSAWAGYGLASVSLVGSYVPETMPNVYLKSGVGYFSSTVDKVAAGDPRTSRDGKSLGTEVYLRTGYKFAKHLDVSLNGAYAWLGDFYNGHGGGTAVNQVATDISNPYEVYVKTTLTF